MKKINEKINLNQIRNKARRKEKNNMWKKEREREHFLQEYMFKNKL